MIKQAISFMIALNGPEKTAAWEGGQDEWSCGGRHGRKRGMLKRERGRLDEGNKRGKRLLILR